MKPAQGSRPAFLLSILLIGAAPSWAFDSGSTGEDGAFSPTVDTELQVPPDGVFNFTSVDIPENVTVTFQKNVLNTPVTVLVSEDATVAGTIDVRGEDSPGIGGAGDGITADDGLPGTGGPGGFDGGRGGASSLDDPSMRIAGDGQGPGFGERAANEFTRNDTGCPGAGAGFGEKAEDAQLDPCRGTRLAKGGDAYGSEKLLPLIGGSGGGGGNGGISHAGAGGAGGGGAILLAVSGTLDIRGEVRADGGRSGGIVEDGGGRGGGGSGGAIRLAATTLSGNGPITARGGNNGQFAVNDGSPGRIRIEAEVMNRTDPTSPPFSFDQPGELFLAGMPSVRITSVAGVDAPAEPTGDADIVLPSDTPNPVNVTFEASNVPLGNTVELTVTPAKGASTAAVSDALDGTESSSTATASVDLPDGPSTLMASVGFTVTDTQSKQLSYYTEGEPVDRIELASSVTGEKRTVLITESGREVAVPAGLR